MSYETLLVLFAGIVCFQFSLSLIKNLMSDKRRYKKENAAFYRSIELSRSEYRSNARKYL